MGTVSPLTNAFGGTVTIEPSWNEYNPDDFNTAYEIVYNGLTKEACITLSTLDWGNTTSTGLLAYRISASSMGRTPLMSDYTCDKQAGEGYVRYG